MSDNEMDKRDRGGWGQISIHPNEMLNAVSIHELAAGFAGVGMEQEGSSLRNQ